mgnify:FL=1
MNWDSLDRLLDEKRPPLCPGNVIMYYQPGPWVASHDGLRRAIVLSVNKVDGIPLKLDTGEFMTGDAAFRCLGRWCFDRNQFIPKETCEMWVMEFTPGTSVLSPNQRPTIVRVGLCKSKGWNGRWDAQGAGAGVECKTERKLSSERGPSQPGPPNEDAEREFAWLAGIREPRRQRCVARTTAILTRARRKSCT